MNEVEKYLREVMRSIQAPPRERARIEADLREHLESALEAGESPSAVVARMGSPEEVAAEFMAVVKFHYAGFWQRLLAFMVDMAIIVVVAGLLFVLATVLSNLVPQGTQLAPPSTTGWDFVIGAILVLAVLTSGLIGIALFLLYFPILEGRFGQTVGKRLFGLRVVKESGAPIGFKEAFLRRLSFYFDFLVVDALFIFFTAKRQRAFDIIARTVVIRET